MANRQARKNPLLTNYRDRQFPGTPEELEQALLKSTTLYAGNLSFFTREEQIYELFSRGGEVKRVIMGLDRERKTPCGFCFIEYIDRAGAEYAMRYVNGTRLDDRIIRTDYDWGFLEGRQFGRGKSGGQVRDEFREDFDEGRGGFGKLILERAKRGEVELPAGEEALPSDVAQSNSAVAQDETKPSTAVDSSAMQS